MLLWDAIRQTVAHASNFVHQTCLFNLRIVAILLNIINLLLHNSYDYACFNE